MTDNLKKQVDKVARLNKARTQGNYRTILDIDGEVGNILCIGESIPICSLPLSINNRYLVHHKDLNNLAFLSYAPEMADIIEKLQARNEELEAALNNHGLLAALALCELHNNTDHEDGKAAQEYLAGIRQVLQSQIDAKFVSGGYRIALMSICDIYEEDANSDAIHAMYAVAQQGLER